VSGKGLKFGKIISSEMVLSSGRYLGQNNRKQRSCGRAKQPKTKELWKGKTTTKKKNKGVVEGQNNQKQRSCGRAKQQKKKTKELWKGKTTKNKGVVEGQNNKKTKEFWKGKTTKNKGVVEAPEHETFGS
jgi:hypothetical protein